MGGRIRTTLRAILIALALVLAFGYAAGARSVFRYSELRCAPGYTAQPVSIARVYQCRPPIPDPTVIQWPDVVTTEDEVGLSLANLRIRVFDIDFAGGTSHWFAFNVPPA